MRGNVFTCVEHHVETLKVREEERLQQYNHKEVAFVSQKSAAKSKHTIPQGFPMHATSQLLRNFG